MALRGSFGILWCVLCPALACYGVLCPDWVSCLVSSGWLWYVSWCAMVMLWYVSLLSSGCAMACLGWLWVYSGMSQCYPLGIPWLALAGSGCTLVCLIAGYALMMSCVKIDHALTLHFGYCLFMLI